MKARLTPRARADLVEIGDYLANEAGRQTARRWVAKLKARVRALAARPYASPQMPYLGMRRRAIVGPYLVVYIVVPPDVVEVVRIVHGARDLPRIFGAADET